jgi:hypothetical protein
VVFFWFCGKIILMICWVVFFFFFSLLFFFVVNLSFVDILLDIVVGLVFIIC